MQPDVLLGLRAEHIQDISPPRENMIHIFLPLAIILTRGIVLLHTSSLSTIPSTSECATILLLLHTLQQPRTCARDKVSVLSVISTNIARSQHPGVLVSGQHCHNVQFRSKALDKGHKCYMQCLPQAWVPYLPTWSPPCMQGYLFTSKYSSANHGN